ncbi:MAG: pyridoxal phosphate-dependent aminotransferase [Pseudomonadota bacterium]
MSLRLSHRSRNILQSEIRAMTAECRRLEGINMAQGVCDLPIPQTVIDGAKAAIDGGVNSYTAAEGLAELRDAIVGKMQRFYGMSVAREEVMVSLGATGAFYSTAQALLDVGDAVILLEPYYGYHAATLRALGCEIDTVRMQPPAWSLQREALEAAIKPNTRAIVISNPSNPSGKVFSREELEMLAELCQAHNLVLFSDEIYEHFVYGEAEHIPPATLPSLRERTVTLSGFSKIFSVTGWRLGYAIAPEAVIARAAQFNDLVYVCPPAPLQCGAAQGLLQLPPQFYRRIAAEHEVKRERFCQALRSAGLEPVVPQGAYYVMADISALPGADDREKVLDLLARTGVASVPGRAFYHDDGGLNLARFCYAKRDDELEEACRRLSRLGG